MESELIKLGFTINEAKIYLQLLKKPDLTAGQISKEAEINRRTTYDSLTRLIEKGFVGYNISSNKKVFFAMNPKVILDSLREMQDLASSIIPSLKLLTEQKKEESNVILYKGRKGIKNILRLILESKEYVSFGSVGQFPQVMQHDYELFQNMKKKLKIKTRTILSSSVKEQDTLKIATPTTHFKFLSEKITGPTSTFIFNNKVAIIIWEEPLFGILIENKQTYNSYLEYFEELWKIAK